MEIEIKERKGIFKTALESFKNFLKLFGSEDITDSIEDGNIEDIATSSGYNMQEIEFLKSSLKSVDVMAQETGKADISLDDEDEEEISKKKRTSFFAKKEKAESQESRNQENVATAFQENASQANNSEGARKLQDDYDEHTQDLVNRIKTRKDKSIQESGEQEK